MSIGSSTDEPGALASTRGVGIPLEIDLTDAIRRQGQWDTAVDVETRLMLGRRGLDAVNTMMVIADVRADDHPLVFVNGFFLTFCGYDAKEVLGRNCRFLQHRPDGTHDNDQPGVGKIRRAIRQGTPARALLRNYRKGGELFWNEVFMSPVRNEHGELTHMIGVQNDVTERMDAAEDRHLLHSVIHDNEDAMLIAAAGSDDQIGVFTHANRAFVALTGLDRHEVVGHAVEKVLGRMMTDRAFGRALQKLSANKRHSDVMEIEPTGGSPVWVRYSVSPVRSRGNRVAQWCHVFRDITEQRRLEQEVVDVVRHEQSRLARDLHDSVAQDLATAALQCSMLGDRIDDAQTKADLIGVFKDIRRAASHARSIAHGLMPDDVIERGLSASLSALASRTTELGSTVCEFLGDDMGIEVSDAVHLYHIAREAVSNAVRHGRARHIVIRLDKTGQSGTLKVTDDGTGFSKETTTKGIGIRTMNSRTRLIGGQLHIDGVPGGGSEVRCTFPLVSRS